MARNRWSERPQLPAVTWDAILKLPLSRRELNIFNPRIQTLYDGLKDIRSRAVETFLAMFVTIWRKTDNRQWDFYIRCLQSSLWRGRVIANQF